MFGPVQPTPYDLTFSLFGIPVRVIPTFWLIGVLFGWDYMHVPKYGFALVLIWVAVVFVSILVHELGHALTALLFGYPPRIVLYHFGGLAMYEPWRDYTAGKSILISFAGPGAGLALYGLVFVVQHTVPIASPLAAYTFGMLVWVNLWWSLINLLPVLPLDGGRISQEVCRSISRQNGVLWSLRISIAVGVLAGVALLKFKLWYAGAMFLLLALQSYQEHEQRNQW